MVNSKATLSKRELAWLAFRCGVIAAVVFGAVMFLLRVGFGMQSVPELVFERLRILLGGEAVSSIIDTFQGLAKRGSLFAMVLFQTIVVGGLLGLLYNRLFARDSQQPPTEDSYPAQAFGNGKLWLNGLVLGGAIWLMMMVVGLPLLGWGFFGSETFMGLPAFPLLSLVLYLSYSLSLTFLYHISVQNKLAAKLYPPPLVPDADRRRFLRRATYVAAAGLVGWGAWRYLSGGPGGSNPTADGQPVSEVTPTDEFYTISKNFLDPIVSDDGWILTIDGLVDKPFSLDYAGIKALPSIEQYVTLSCISNVVGGNLTGNAKWRGVRLADLLQQAGVQGNATEVILHAADGYTDSTPLDTARLDYNLLAYDMNDEPLRSSHGAPVRLLVPAIYGMKNVKWITRIELANADHKGYWQSQGWNDTARVNVNSRITIPANQSNLPAGLITLGGSASAGDRSISKVELSFDGGQSWQAATIKPPLSPYTWVLWTYEWQANPGSYRIAVRATDARGEVQTDRYAEPFPSGSTGYHVIAVKIG